MLNLLFSPTGRINAAAFLKASYVLIALGFIINCMPAISYELSSLINLLGLVLIWCWVVIFVKRLHDANKSGWVSLAPIIAFVVLLFIASQLVATLFGGDLVKEMEAASLEAAENGSISDIMRVTMEYAKPLAQKLAIPSAVSQAVVSLVIVLITNAALKSDPNNNQYGPSD